MQTSCLKSMIPGLDSGPDCRPHISTAAQGGRLSVTVLGPVRWQLQDYVWQPTLRAPAGMAAMSDGGEAHREEGVVGGHDVVLLAEGPGRRRALLSKLLRPPLRRRVLGAELVGPGVRGVGLLIELIRPGGAPALALLHPNS